MKAAKTTQTSDTKLLVPLAVLGGLVGCFILIGFSYDLFKRNSSNVTGKTSTSSLHFICNKFDINCLITNGLFDNI